MSDRNRAWRRKQEIAHRKKKEQRRKFRKFSQKKLGNDIGDSDEIQAYEHSTS